jgi:hypothetical protein
MTLNAISRYWPSGLAVFGFTAVVGLLVYAATDWVEFGLMVSLALFIVLGSVHFLATLLLYPSAVDAKVNAHLAERRTHPSLSGEWWSVGKILFLFLEFSSSKTVRNIFGITFLFFIILSISNNLDFSFPGKELSPILSIIFAFFYIYIILYIFSEFMTRMYALDTFIQIINTEKFFNFLIKNPIAKNKLHQFIYFIISITIFIIKLVIFCILLFFIRVLLGFIVWYWNSPSTPAAG